MFPRLYIALDTVDLATAKRFAQIAENTGAGIKIGLEFFMALGRTGYEALAHMGAPVFLDLKFHDIPNTVVGALRGLEGLDPQHLTIHASGGPEMMKRAVGAAQYHLPDTRILAVTVLTSLDDEDLSRMGIRSNPLEQVCRMAELASASGCHGVVCSPAEVGAIRQQTSNGFDLVVPGIRPGGQSEGDQKRVMTPGDALKAGATALVVGRPITQAQDPQKAATEIVASINS